MEVLKEISKVSTYKPKKGANRELYNLTVSGKYNRQQAEEYFNQKYSEGLFPAVYKRVKYKMLDGLLNVPTSKIPEDFLSRVRIWKRQLQVRVLFITGNKTAAVKLAVQAVSIAEKNHEFEVLKYYCKKLALYYSNYEPDLKKYTKYIKKHELANRLTIEENKAELTYHNLVVAIKYNLPLESIKASIIELDLNAKTNNFFRFKYYYYNLKSLYFRTIKDSKSFIENNKIALDFFEGLEQDVASQTKYVFLSDIVPYYIFQGQFSRAGNSINDCVRLPPIGSFNWHKILLYKAYLGFYSRKPKVSLNALKTAFSVKAKTDSQVIFERWHIMEGYLGIYNKQDKVPLTKVFKIKRYLNIDEKNDNHIQKANLLIIELLYLLFDNRHQEYFKKTEGIEHYISTRFKAHKFKRTRCFLRMLKTVIKGNYHPKLVQAHAQKNYKKLVDMKKELDINSLDIEYVPYEILWDEVINKLSKK